MRPVEVVKGEVLACTFCAFCRRSCPVYRATLWEGDSPRGRIAQAHGLLDGDLEPDDGFYSSVLNCSLCGACEGACPPRIRMVDVVLALREELAAAASPPARLAGLLAEARQPIPELPGAEVLVLGPGSEGAARLLSSLGLEAAASPAPPLHVLRAAGYSGEFRARAEGLMGAIEESGASEVVFTDPGDVWALSEAGFGAKHYSQLVDPSAVRPAGRPLAYEPSCLLRRAGIEAPDLLAEALGVEVEVPCLGLESGWLEDEVLGLLARERRGAAGGRTLVTPAPRAAAERSSGTGVVELWEALLTGPGGGT